MANAAVERAENIALLHLLHPIPLPPLRNAIDKSGFPDRGYALSFEDERAVVGTLAFLSCMEDDSSHVPAICLQEQSTTEFANVLVAVNKVSKNDGRKVLEAVKEGFERLFRILSTVTDTRSVALEHDVFSAIILMCEQRILRRLRFIPGKRGVRKQPFGEALQRAIKHLHGLSKQEQHKLASSANAFVARAKAAIKSANDWLKHRSRDGLEKLVGDTFSLSQISSLSLLLGDIPNNILDPSARKSLLNTITKTARYREAATMLYRKSRKIPLLRGLRIVMPEIPGEWFDRSSTVTPLPNIQSTILRVGLKRNAKADYICRLIGTTESTANGDFRKQVNAILREAKIHAEIQLLLLLRDIDSSSRPPRVICSSKDACFLCDAFIRMYGKIHVPGSHGRLYPGWRLPQSLMLNELEQRFNVVLGGMIRDSINLLESRKQKTVYPEPNESTVLTLKKSVSTLLPSSIRSVDAGLNTTLLSPKYSTSSLSRTDPSISKSLPISGLRDHDKSAKSGQLPVLVARSISRPQSQTSIHPSHLSSADGDTEIIPDSAKTGTCYATLPSFSYDSKRIKIQIDPPDDYLKRTSGMSAVGTNIEIAMLTVEQRTSLVESQAGSIIDVNTFVDGAVYGLDALNCLYLGTKDFVVRIGFWCPS